MKLQYVCHLGTTEVGGFGVTADPEQPLYVTDFHVLPQESSWASVDFSDVGVADYTDDRLDEGLKFPQFLRVWIHTHPGDCPEPSRTDEQTFAKRFGDVDWAVMAILARGGDTYARLRVKSLGTIHAEVMLPVEVAWEDFQDGIEAVRASMGELAAGWREEHAKNVTKVHNLVWVPASYGTKRGSPARTDPDRVVDFELDAWAGGATPAGLDDNDVRPDSVEAFLDDNNLDMEDLVTMATADMAALGFTADDVEALNRGMRIDRMNDRDYRLYREEWEFAHGNDDGTPQAAQLTHTTDEDDDSGSSQTDPEDRGRAEDDDPDEDDDAPPRQWRRRR